MPEPTQIDHWGELKKRAQVLEDYVLERGWTEMDLITICLTAAGMQAQRIYEKMGGAHRDYVFQAADELAQKFIAGQPDLLAHTLNHLAAYLTNARAKNRMTIQMAETILRNWEPPQTKV